MSIGTLLHQASLAELSVKVGDVELGFRLRRPDTMGLALAGVGALVQTPPSPSDAGARRRRGPPTPKRLVRPAPDAPPAEVAEWVRSQGVERIRGGASFAAGLVAAAVVEARIGGEAWVPFRVCLDPAEADPGANVVHISALPPGVERALRAKVDELLSGEAFGRAVASFRP